MAKRTTAKYCSSICRERARPARPQPTAAQRRAWRQRRLTQDGYRERVNAIENARARAVKAWISDFKVSAGCIDCGYNSHPAALDIDQVILEGDLDCGLVEIIVERLAGALAAATPESVPVAQVVEGSFRARAGALGATTLPLFFNFSPRSSILTGTAPMFREFRDYAVRA